MNKSLAHASTNWLVLSASALCWMVQDAKGQNQLHTETWNGSASALQQLIAQASQVTYPTVVLSPSLARHWLQTPPSGITSLQELHAVASSRANQLFGASAKQSDASDASDFEWHVSGDWHAAHAFVCTAWPAHLSLQHAKLHTHLSIALNRHQSDLPRNGWCAITIACELHLMQMSDGQIMYMRSMRVPAILNNKEIEDRLVQEWQRDLLRTSAQANQVSWLNLMPSEDEKYSHPLVLRVNLNQSPAAKACALNLPSEADTNEACLAAWSMVQMVGSKL